MNIIVYDVSTECSCVCVDYYVVIIKAHGMILSRL